MDRVVGQSSRQERRAGRPPRWRTVARLILLALVLVPVLALGGALAGFARDVGAARTFYVAPGQPRDDGQRVTLAPTRSLRVLPLVEWYAARPDLETESGLSYLVQTDDSTVLLDLGFNPQHSAEPPLLRNMQRLGVSPADVDLVVISHPHVDHLNGANGDRAILQPDDDPLAVAPVFSTVPLTVTGGTSTVVSDPRTFAPQIGTTGALPVGLFVAGYTLEQSLVVDLEGRGLVLVVGCGHPGVEALVNRAEQVFQRPVYGVIGGMHLMARDGRAKLGPIPTQKVLASSTPPWQPTSEADVVRAIDFLKSAEVKVVGLSAHDSDDWTLDQFAAAFGPGYRQVRVGELIVP